MPQNGPSALSLPYNSSYCLWYFLSAIYAYCIYVRQLAHLLFSNDLIFYVAKIKFRGSESFVLFWRGFLYYCETCKSLRQSQMSSFFLIDQNCCLSTIPDRLFFRDVCQFFFFFFALMVWYSRLTSSVRVRLPHLIPFHCTAQQKKKEEKKKNFLPPYLSTSLSISILLFFSFSFYTCSIRCRHVLFASFE